MSYLVLKNIKKNFDKKSLAQLKDINFEVEKGEMISIIGPSGTGKTTLFKVITGELDPDEGEVLLNNKSVCIEKVSLLSSDLKLDESLNVIENIIQGLNNTNFNRGEKVDLAREMIEVFGLEYKDKKSLDELSAGQQQRVRLARAIIKKPELLLLDEPFTNLDEFLKAELIGELKEVIDSREITTLLITHHLQEAFSLSDRVMLLANGGVIQFDTPENIYEKPIDVYTARFTGEINLVASNLLKTDHSYIYLKNPYGEFKVEKSSSSSGLEIKKFLYMACRAENVELDEASQIQGKVIKKEYRGSYYCYRLRTAEKNPIIFHSKKNFKLGEKLRVSFNHLITLAI